MLKKTRVRHAHVHGCDGLTLWRTIRVRLRCRTADAALEDTEVVGVDVPIAVEIGGDESVEISRQRAARGQPRAVRHAGPRDARREDREIVLIHMAVAVEFPNQQRF